MQRLDRAAVAAVTVMPAAVAKRKPASVLDEPTAGLRHERMVESVHALGVRPLAEMLAEIAVATGRPDIVADRIEAYARLDPEIVRFLGADRFPPSVLGVVR